MKKYIIVFLFFSSLNSFSDAGNAYRFYLEIITSESDTITGYFYHYSYKEYNKQLHHDKAFINFIKKDTIVLYSFISTVNIGNFALDFTSSNYKKTIPINNIDHIRRYEILEFNVGDRLIELSESKFKLIKLQPPIFEIIYNEKYAENCSFFLLSWNKNSRLLKYKTEISEKLKMFTKNLIKNQDALYQFLDQKREKLFLENIILITYCDAL